MVMNMCNTPQIQPREGALHLPALSATALKLIAVLFMTVDHLGACGIWPDITHSLGRAAAPMFLYFVVESLRHTRSRKRYLLRMWLASLAIGMANLVH